MCVCNLALVRMNECTYACIRSSLSLSLLESWIPGKVSVSRRYIVLEMEKKFLSIYHIKSYNIG